MTEGMHDSDLVCKEWLPWAVVQEFDAEGHSHQLGGSNSRVVFVDIADGNVINPSEGRGESDVVGPVAIVDYRVLNRLLVVALCFPHGRLC